MAWCEAHGLKPLPADPQTVAVYLAARAEAGLAVASLSLALAAIGEAHRVAGYESPRSTPAVREVWRGIKRAHGTAQRRVEPVTVEILRAMVRSLPETLVGARDRALLLTGFAGGLRRSEIVELCVEDLGFERDGVRVTIRRSKTDPEGAGAVIGIPSGASDTCPVRSLRAWVDGSGTSGGHVFRAISRYGRLGGPLSGRDVARIVKRGVERIGLDPADYSGHSLRSGLATTAARAGKSDRSIARQGRWSSRTMIDRYVREARLLHPDNAAAGIGL